MDTPEEEHMADQAAMLGAMEDILNAMELLSNEQGQHICHCGVEVTPDMPEHAMCFPGM